MTADQLHHHRNQHPHHQTHTALPHHSLAHITPSPFLPPRLGPLGDGDVDKDDDDNDDEDGDDDDDDSCFKKRMAYIEIYGRSIDR